MFRDFRNGQGLQVATAIVCGTVVGLASGANLASAGDSPAASQLPRPMNRDAEVALALSSCPAAVREPSSRAT